MEQQWEIELTQLRALMRNEITSHDRIRDRVLRLQEMYYDGFIDGNINWERWACDRFAYNHSWLRFMSRPHPLTLDSVQRQLQKEQDKLIEGQRQFDADQANMGWKNYNKELKAADKAGLSVRVSQEIDDNAVKKALAAKTKQKKQKKPAPQLSLALPPAEITIKHLEACGEMPGKTRVMLGRGYAALRELVQAQKVGKDPITGKPWSWVKWSAQYIRRSRQDIIKCIALYEASASNDASGVISQDDNVYTLKRGEN